jgi:PAS domain S-box-containing protein
MDYRSFFDLSYEMLATSTFDGYFQTVNGSFERVLGYTEDELLRSPFLTFVHPEDRQATVEEFERLVAGERRTGFENRYRCRNGSYRRLRWSATPSPEQGLIYTVALDVTDLHAKDVALNKLVADLQRSNEDLTQFAYVASHDLSEPLRVVSGHVELLARRYQGQLDEDADRYIEFAVNGCVRMRTLIEDLLTFSRAGREEDGSGSESERESVDLQVVTSEALTSLGTLIGETGATIHVGELPTVVGSSSQFGQVIANLISNSLKFHQPGQPPAIEISATREQSAWRIEVADDGIGIEPAYRDRIFRIFQRLHDHDSYPGTGIGLALCRKMIQLRGGRIWCEDNQPRGTTFCFTIPDQIGTEP